MSETAGRFRFLGDPRFVLPGQIPCVCLFNDEALPPINKVRNIFPRTQPQNQWNLHHQVRFFWQVGDYVPILAEGLLTDRRVKEQYLADDESQRIINEFIKQQTCGEPNRVFSTIGGPIIDRDELPEEGQPYFDQAFLWAAVVSQIKALKLTIGASAKVDDSEYYVIEIRTDWLAAKHSCYQPCTIFNNQPEILDDCICWADNECKIKFILQHHLSTPSIAKRFGYLEIYEEVMQKRREEEKIQSANTTRSRQIISQEAEARYRRFVDEMMTPLPE
ncbi:MAG: hypothetical protein Athens101428_688 [Candidatus Berkelbacteria bacterium Athens1014_28]|uniref:Uncharacterized protein n=1 Tax=Candidatus Berkelbacteria bacterium Athens1014_28 TaxID=2017145 RepID=A0A554LKI2_9BACT|nr:MAG: hypothetical protein Athens101428_688 [Candidatus Berkelbacteria bacterium Athens1014_28]